VLNKDKWLFVVLLQEEKDRSKQGTWPGDPRILAGRTHLLTKQGRAKMQARGSRLCSST
jgi:hypothetical protein